jgi:hypothetical protein
MLNDQRRIDRVIRNHQIECHKIFAATESGNVPCDLLPHASAQCLATLIILAPDSDFYQLADVLTADENDGPEGAHVQGRRSSRSSKVLADSVSVRAGAFNRAVAKQKKCDSFLRSSLVGLVHAKSRKDLRSL